MITANSPRAAEASQCAADQGQFWEYHDYLYEQATGLTEDQLVGYAGNLGLDTSEFTNCLNAGTHRDYIEEDSRTARLAGARGTPTFMVNGQLVAAPTFAILTAAIREAQGDG